MMAKLNSVNVDLRNSVLSVCINARTPSRRHYCHGVSSLDRFSRLLDDARWTFVSGLLLSNVISMKLNCDVERRRGEKFNDEQNRLRNEFILAHTLADESVVEVVEGCWVIFIFCLYTHTHKCQWRRRGEGWWWWWVSCCWVALMLMLSCNWVMKGLRSDLSTFPPNFMSLKLYKC
jgi:hypothetical protein